jgi:hypothetical protein
MERPLLYFCFSPQGLVIHANENLCCSIALGFIALSFELPCGENIHLEKKWSHGCCGSDQRAIGVGTTAAMTIVVTAHLIVITQTVFLARPIVIDSY